MKSKAELIVALDVDTLSEAKKLVNELSPVVQVFKIGSHLFTAYGPDMVHHVMSKKRKVFLDLKFHDIPNTVAGAVRSVVGLGKNKNDGVLMCTIHTLGGEEMLKQAAKAAKEESKRLSKIKPLILGITVLTSESRGDDTAGMVMKRAALAKRCGLDGIVASCKEAKMIRKEFGKNFVIVTPGIRPVGADAGDQKRVATPADAVLSGSNYLVVGRPIIKANDPLKAAKEILKEIASS